MFPKVAVVLGAHTELGKLVVRHLLRSPYVSKVHALAEVDPRDGILVRPQHQRKLALYLEPLDDLEETVSRYIRECDIAFCVSGCGKKDMAAMGAYKFHKTNLDIPRRFIHEMLSLGVERIALLSHADASRKARGSEFLRVKGELESILRELQREAAEHAPGVTVFKVPLILTNLKDASGIRGTSITTTDKFKQKAAVKMDLSPARAVHVRDVALAMVADMFRKLYMAETSREIEPAFRRRDIRYDEIDGQRVVNLANQHRAMQQEYKSRERHQVAFDQRISGYARKHVGRGSALESSVRYSHGQSESSHRESARESSVRYSQAQSEGSHEYSRAQSQGSVEQSERPPGHWKREEDDSNESYMSGSPPDEDMVEDEDLFNYGEEGPMYYNESSTLSHGEDQGPYSPVPSSEPRRFEEEGHGLGSEGFRSPERRRRSHSHAPVTSVDALGDQLGRRLTFIRDNEYLPDAVSRPMQSSRRSYPDEHFNAELSRRTVSSPRHTQEYGNDEVGLIAEADFGGERRDPNQSFDSDAPSLPSPPSRPPSMEMRQDSPVQYPGFQHDSEERYAERQDSPARVPEMQHDSPVRYAEAERGRFNPPPNRYSTSSYNRSPSHSKRYSGRGTERHSTTYGSGRLYRRESDYRGGIRSERDESRPSSLITRVTEFAERVIAATDRPSMKRRDTLSRKQSSRGRLPLRGQEEAMLRAGETTI